MKDLASTFSIVVVSESIM